MTTAFFFFFFLVGGFLFWLGFRKYREYRLLEDTPRAPVRSIPMGLVHLTGKSTGEHVLTSPLTRTPRLYAARIGRRTGGAGSGQFHAELGRQDSRQGAHGSLRQRSQTQPASGRTKAPFHQGTRQRIRGLPPWRYGLRYRPALS